MDRYGQIGPAKGDYDADVHRVAQQLLRHVLSYVALADRGGRLNLVLVSRWDLPALGAKPEGIPPADNERGWLFVAVEDHGAYWFKIDAPPVAGYVASKLGVADGDGEILVEFMERLSTHMRAEV